MKKSCPIIYVLFVLFLSLTSCEDNTGDPNAVSEDFFSFKNGDYLIYDSYDISGSGVVSGTVTKDSIVFSFPITVEGNSGIAALRYRNDILIDTLYYYFGAGFLARYFSSKELDIIEGQPAWLKIADLDEQKWNAYRITHEEYSIVHEGIEYQSLAEFVYNVDSQGKDSIEIDSKKYYSANFRLKSDFKFTFKQTVYDTILEWEDPDTGDIKDTIIKTGYDVEMIQTKYTRYRFAEEIGPAYIKTEPYHLTTSVFLEGNLQSRSFEEKTGSYSGLIRIGK